MGLMKNEINSWNMLGIGLIGGLLAGLGLVGGLEKGLELPPDPKKVAASSIELLSMGRRGMTWPGTKPCWAGGSRGTKGAGSNTMLLGSWPWFGEGSGLDGSGLVGGRVAAGVVGLDGGGANPPEALEEICAYQTLLSLDFRVSGIFFQKSAIKTHSHSARCVFLPAEQRLGHGKL